MTNLEKAMKFILKYEGGYVNDPQDAGGETRYGISKRAYPDMDIKNLTLSEAILLYKRDYWDSNELSNLSFPLCIVAMDSYVQHRNKVVDKMLEDSDDSWRKMLSLRREFYLKLIEKNPSQIRFKRGWLTRLNDLDKYCSILEQEEAP